jgi:hypothetical protein
LTMGSCTNPRRTCNELFIKICDVHRAVLISHGNECAGDGGASRHVRSRQEWHCLPGSELTVLDCLMGKALLLPQGGLAVAVLHCWAQRGWYHKRWTLLCCAVLWRAVQVVLNYDAPRNLETYLHRVGRTARAGLEGLAVSLITDDDRWVGGAAAAAAAAAGLGVLLVLAWRAWLSA